MDIVGKGTYKWKENGALYDGDWKRGKRNGFGTYSMPDGKGGYKKEYSGGWKNDMRHASFFWTFTQKVYINKSVITIQFYDYNCPK